MLQRPDSIFDCSPNPAMSQVHLFLFFIQGIALPSLMWYHNAVAWHRLRQTSMPLVPPLSDRFGHLSQSAMLTRETFLGFAPQL